MPERIHVFRVMVDWIKSFMISAEDSSKQVVLSLSSVVDAMIKGGFYRDKAIETAKSILHKDTQNAYGK